jgi:uncharacterized membrane protein YkoI
MKADRVVTAVTGVVIILMASGSPHAEEQAQPAQTKQKAVREKMNGGPEETNVTIEQAIRAALDHVPGRVHELEVVHKSGKLVWAVEVITPEARHFMVDVDGVSGKDCRGPNQGQGHL